MSSQQLMTVLMEANAIELKLIECHGEITKEIEDRLLINDIRTKENVDRLEILINRLEKLEEFFKSKRVFYANLEKGCDRARTYLRDGAKFTMIEAGVDEIFGHDIRMILQRTAPALKLIEELIGDEYKKQVITTEIDKAKIKEALKEGKEVLGAELVEVRSLRIYPIGPKQKQVTA